MRTGGAYSERHVCGPGRLPRVPHRQSDPSCGKSLPPHGNDVRAVSPEWMDVRQRHVFARAARFGHRAPFAERLPEGVEGAVPDTQQGIGSSLTFPMMALVYRVETQQGNTRPSLSMNGMC